MYRKLEDFHKGWKSHSDSTRKLFAALTDESLACTVADGHRTLGGMAWHIVTTIPEMMGQAGLSIPHVDEKSLPPATAAEIVAGYDAASMGLALAVSKSWDDSDLSTIDDLYGEKWPRGLTLAILIHHEAHHRGQMTVLMRQAGIKVPGIYGPSQEEWATYGMEKPPY